MPNMELRSKGHAQPTKPQGEDTGDATKPGRSIRQLEAEPEPQPEPTLADIQLSIATLSASVCGKLDLLAADVASIKRRQTELEESVTMNSDNVAEIQQETLPALQKEMEEKVAKLEEKILSMEIYQRRANLLFYGVEESPNEDIYEVLRGVFVYLGVNPTEAAKIAIVNAHRLPRRTNGAPAATNRPQAPFPIIAKFVYMGHRNRILAAFEDSLRQRDPQAAPRTRRITVRTDLPPVLKARRGILAKTAYDLRKQKGVSTKIVVVGSNVQLKWKEKNSSFWNNYKD